MAYKEHGMWEILDVLRRIHGGEGVRAVARQTGRARNTVKRYVETATELGWIAGLHDPDEALAALVLRNIGLAQRMSRVRAQMHWRRTRRKSASGSVLKMCTSAA